MTSVSNLSTEHTFFIRENPDLPGQVQCGYLSAIEPAESGMTFKLMERLLRIEIPGQKPLYLNNVPSSIIDALLAGAEFWVGSLEEDGDAYLASPQ